MIFYLNNITRNIIAASTLVLSLLLMSGFVSFTAINPAKAETGQGEDIFRVIMTILE
jgi:hypothetical protein